MQKARFSLQWCSVVRGKQQKNDHWQVGSSRASPLTCSQNALQTRSLLVFPKMARNAKCAFFGAMGLGQARQAAG